jgi:flagellar biosynthesis protein FliQ
MGGFVLIRSYEPLDLLRINFPEEKELVFVLVSPEFEAPTKKMRAALPADISMKDHVKNSSQAASLVAALYQASEDMNDLCLYFIVCFLVVLHKLWITFGLLMSVCFPYQNNWLLSKRMFLQSRASQQQPSVGRKLFGLYW